MMWGGSLLPAIEKFNLGEYCAEHGGDQDGEGRYEWTLLCPSCGKDKLIVNTEKKTWHCWVCQNIEWVLTTGGWKKKALAGAGGLIDLIQFLDQCTRQEAVLVILRQDLLDPAALAEIPQGEILISHHLENDFNSLSMAPAIPFPEGRDIMSPYTNGYHYLRHRGIEAHHISEYGLFWCSSGRYANRVVFPVYEGGTFVYFQARAAWEEVQHPFGTKFIKSLNPAHREGAAVSSDVLFNFDRAVQCPTVCITEGPLDAIQAGDDAVAVFGKQISGLQVAKLVRAGVKRVQLMWDSDAYADMRRVAPLLSVFFDVSIVRLPNGDPGGFTREQNAWYRANSVEHQHGNLLTI